MRDQIFISYSHADKQYLERLKVHLKPFLRSESIKVWEDTQIQSGNRWFNDIQNALSKSAVAILLISTDFLASDFIANKELPPLLEAEEKNGIKILPFIIKPSLFSEIEELSQFQAVNNPQKPLSSQTEDQQEMWWCTLVKEARDALENFKTYHNNSNNTSTKKSKLNVSKIRLSNYENTFERNERLENVCNFLKLNNFHSEVLGLHDHKGTLEVYIKPDSKLPKRDKEILEQAWENVNEIAKNIEYYYDMDNIEVGTPVT